MDAYNRYHREETKVWERERERVGKDVAKYEEWEKEEGRGDEDGGAEGGEAEMRPG